LSGGISQEHQKKKYQMKREGYIYIMTNKHKNVLYIGVTSDLKKRIWEHRHHFIKDSFTDKYNIEFLIYYEGFDNIEEAIQREKQLKKWSRAKKEYLISTKNKRWKDLFEEIINDDFKLL